MRKLPKNKRNKTGEMSFLDHLRELRRRLIVSSAAIVVFSVLAFVFYRPVITFFLRPFEHLSQPTGEDILYINSLFEGFLARVEISVIAGIVFTLPVHLYNIVAFILPALTIKEKRIVLTALASSALFLLFAFFYGYNRVIPVSVQFLTSRGFFPSHVGMLLNFKQNILFIFQLILIAMLVFQIPIILEALMILDLLRRKALFRASRYVVVCIFILAAVVTPPDFLSQLCIAIPLVALYFLTILVARIFNFGREP